jgi:hypothetical protein
MIRVPGSGNGRSEQGPTRSLGESLMIARHLFWIWRRSRPFWGGLLVIVGATEMLVSEQDPFPVVAHTGIQGWAGFLIPAHLLLFGFLLWLNPIDRTIYSLIAILLALWSWITSDLGGFFVGMLLGVIGGALAFAWTTDAKHGSPSRRVHGKQPIAMSSYRLDLTIRPTGHAPPQLEGRAGTAGSAHAALSCAGEMKLADLTDDEAQGVRPSSDRRDGDGQPPGSLRAPVT